MAQVLVERQGNVFVGEMVLVHDDGTRDKLVGATGGIELDESVPPIEVAIILVGREQYWHPLGRSAPREGALALDIGSEDSLMMRAFTGCERQPILSAA